MSACTETECERDVRELAVERGDDLADSLGSTSGRGDDVVGDRTTTTPVLGGGTIDGLLGGSVGVDGGHETLNETPVVVDDLGERSQAVGGARSVGDDGVFALVGLVVDTHDEHLDRVRQENTFPRARELTGASAEGAEMTTFLAPPFK